MSKTLSARRMKLGSSCWFADGVMCLTIGGGSQALYLGMTIVLW